MKYLIATLFLSSLFFSVPMIATAGAGHDHGHAHATISGTEAQLKATQKVKKLAEVGRIESSWANISSSDITKKDFGRGPEWVIIFTNDKISDVSKRTLYLFYKLDGHYLATNFSGK